MKEKKEEEMRNEKKIKSNWEKNKNLQKYLKHIWIDSVFNADFKYDIRFESNCDFVTEKRINIRQKSPKIRPPEQYVSVFLKYRVVSEFRKYTVL